MLARRGGRALVVTYDGITAAAIVVVPPARVTVTGPSGNWLHSLTPRHGEIPLSLILHREGRSASELAEDLSGDSTRTVTVRAEMSRLRKVLGTVLSHRPYRIAHDVGAELVEPLDRRTALDGSTAPVVTLWRTAR